MRYLLIALTLLACCLTAAADEPLPKIPGVTATTTEAVPAMTYPDRFVKTVVIRADNEKATIFVEMAYYNYAAKKFDPVTKPLKFTIANGYEQAKKYTVWQQTLAAILQTLALAGQEHEYQQEIGRLTELIEAAEEDTSALEAAKTQAEAGLAAVRKAMGPIKE